MEKTSNSNELNCRACLTQKRSLRSIFQRDKVLTYAEIIGYIANVKIEPNDGYSDKICSICRTKAVEAFEFKNNVQQADHTLRGYVNNFRKLNFNDISDIKLEIDCIISENIVKSEDMRLKLDFDTDETMYNNVLIKKLPNPAKKDITFEEFMKDNNIKYEVPDLDFDDADENHFNDDDYINGDEYLSAAISSKSIKPKKSKSKKRTWKSLENLDVDYMPYRKPVEKKTKPAGKKGRPKKYTYHTDKLTPEQQSKNIINNVLIQPIVLTNYRVLSLQPDEETLKKRKECRKLKSLNKQNDNKRICPYCGRICSSKHALNSHIITHEGTQKYKCPECPKQYYTSGGLKNHSFTHAGEKRIQCDKCPLKFYQKCQLRSHLKKHEEIRKCVCDICSKSFKRLCTLKRHILRHSSANKIIKCEQCNMSFFETGQLKHHLRIHTGERPFKCELCSQPYSYKHDFNRHCFNKHGVFMKYRSNRVMNQQVLEQEREDVRTLIDSTPELELPTPAMNYPRIMDTAQLSRLFNRSMEESLK